MLIYCIYLHRNLINHKVYIGQTKHGKNPNLRWKSGKGYFKQKEFYKDILEYGWDNFEHIILADNLSLDEANNLEPKFIEIYSALESINGYNQLKGGNNASKDRQIIILQSPKNNISDLSEKDQYYNDKNGNLRYEKTPKILNKNYQRYLEKSSKYV